MQCTAKHGPSTDLTDVPFSVEIDRVKMRTACTARHGDDRWGTHGRHPRRCPRSALSRVIRMLAIFCVARVHASLEIVVLTMASNALHLGPLFLFTGFKFYKSHRAVWACILCFCAASPIALRWGLLKTSRMCIV